MDALITLRSTLSEADSGPIRSANPDFGTSGLVELVLTDGAHGPDAPGQTSINVFTPLPRASFDHVAIGQSITLFDDGIFSRAFLWYALALVRPGGRLTIFRTPAATKGLRGFMSMDRIAAFLGRAASVVPGQPPNAAAFGRRQALLEAPVSVLTSYLDHFDEILQVRPQFAKAQDFAPFLEGTYPETEASQGESPSPFERSELVRRASANSYLVGGIRYKAPLLHHLIRGCVANAASRPLAIVDVGTGSGLLPIELALHEGLDIRYALGVDYDYSSLSMTRIIYNAHEKQLRGRFAFAVSRAEDFDYRRKFDVISFVGSLLYVPRPQLTAVLDRSFDAVAPGGMLVVHENMRDERYVQDLQFMFTGEEIDGHLGRYGTIRYFMSTATTEKAQAEVGDLTVFRVVQKPS